MYYWSMMCFSSSIICLLIVTTSHSSVISSTDYLKNHNESRFHDTSHLSSKNLTKYGHDRHQASGSFESMLGGSYQTKSTKKGPLSSFETLRTIKSSSQMKRNTRAAADDLILPLPKMQRRSSHADHDHSSKPLTSSSKVEKRKTSAHSHMHHHHNDTDDSEDHHDISDEDHNINGETHHHQDSHERSHASDISDSDEDHHHHSSEMSSSENEGNDENSVKEGGLPDGHSSNHDGHSCDHHHEHGEEHSSDVAPSADFHQHFAASSRNISGKEWLYASLAVIIISLCGLFSVAVIPIMQKWFYHTLLQFLVGLAIGSLSGDGLLHLMPHAILDGEDTHDHSKENSHHHTNGVSLQSMEKTAIWRGLAALGGIFLFFIAERLLGALTTYRRRKKEAKLSRHPKNMLPVLPKEEGANNGNVGEKLAQPKKNSYDHIKDKDEKETIQMLQTEATPSKKGSNQSVHEIGFHGRSSFSLEPEVSVAYRPDSESSVIVSEHHGHGHGHSHEIPQSVTAVAWMVIMGDGLHNFCDGLAIGAAFASGDADGISTTVAVFCHELPHELGDFAMLLKTGMKVKQALFYNGLSSVLCFVGMVIGVSLGNVHSATSWVFAGTAGMFLYIALVDMLPELTSPTNDPGPAALTTLLVQVLGIAIGICVMLLIALYEHELHSIVS
ncbi:zinc transporter ZIP10-like [Stegodyphus dumicola]|uniref:zinc transporter ZIP10-like n=1 Tax=Stegodyphus dumicola TaxID=202533 RepID=UPI0015AB9961|nr:zinc transporter ZIP10-like [Stegodyphus dumicola]XP_035222164.1 zinc transporter ZIP10-like [Stegodyphus dumicola]